MVIISASYKTDIPAFYGEWFRNRLRAGYCRMVNPYNPRQRRLISLSKDDVDGFVFWTKNLAPFSESLNDVHEQGYPFVVQYTINGYPRALESRVVDHQKAVDSFADASRRYGQRSLVWRYDTVILSTLTDAQFHKDNFTKLADCLAGSTDEVVVSFLQLYKKTSRNMDIASEEHGFRWHDPTVGEKQELLASFERSASERGMRLSICAQPELMMPGVSEARCVDAQRLTDVSGRPVVAELKGNAPGMWLLQVGRHRRLRHLPSRMRVLLRCHGSRESAEAVSRARPRWRVSVSAKRLAREGKRSRFERGRPTPAVASRRMTVTGGTALLVSRRVGRPATENEISWRALVRRN